MLQISEVGAQIHRRIAVAVQAPLHLQGVLRIHQRHLVDASMTTGAADALIHVNVAIEVNEVRKVVDTNPLDGGSRRPAHALALKIIGVGPDLRVTVDTGLGGWNSCIGRLLYLRVAVLALQAETFDVMLAG